MKSIFLNVRRILLSLMMLCIVGAAFSPLFSQENLADMYLRKAVKEFVARQYDAAINDLDQALVVDPANAKAKKLLSKCWERKGSLLLTGGETEAAGRSFRMALETDPSNEDAGKGMQRVEAARSSPTPVAQSRPADMAPSIPAAVAAPPSSAPIVITSQMAGGDTQQAKVVAGLFANFQKQQELMAQQMAASNQLVQKTDEQKDLYLSAIVDAAEQKNRMMREFIVVGGVVVFAIILLVMVAFIFIFGKYSHAAELRTVQATEALQTLLANQPLQIKDQARLLLSGPDAPSQSNAPVPGSATHPEAAAAREGVTGVTLEELSSSDPSERAKAVEVFESELADGGASNPDFAPRIAKLRELLGDENNRVRANAAKAFYYVEPSASLKIFMEMLAGSSSRLRASALWALGEIGSLEAFELILSSENETDEIVRYNIRMASTSGSVNMQMLPEEGVSHV